MQTRSICSIFGFGVRGDQDGQTSWERMRVRVHLVGNPMLFPEDNFYTLGIFAEAMDG